MVLSDKAEDSAVIVRDPKRPEVIFFELSLLLDPSEERVGEQVLSPVCDVALSGGERGEYNEQQQEC